VRRLQRLRKKFPDEAKTGPRGLKPGSFSTA
jgi:hypothetical protein